jgi:hypothetical protein
MADAMTLEHALQPAHGRFDFREFRHARHMANERQAR